MRGEFEKALQKIKTQEEELKFMHEKKQQADERLIENSQVIIEMKNQIAEYERGKLLVFLK